MILFKNGLGHFFSFSLQPLSDEEKMSALRLRAHARGIELTDDVLAFILHRASRDMAELFEYLQRLDTISLAENYSPFPLSRKR